MEKDDYLSIVLTGVVSVYIKAKVRTSLQVREQCTSRPTVTPEVPCVLVAVCAVCAAVLLGSGVTWRSSSRYRTWKTKAFFSSFFSFLYLKQIPGSLPRPSWSAAPPSPCLPSGCSITAVISHVNSFTLPLIWPFITPPPVALWLRGPLC